METGDQVSPVNKKLLVLVAVVLAVLLIAFCYVMFLIIRNRLSVQPAQPQLAPTQVPLPVRVTPETPDEPEVVFLPVVVNQGAPAAIAVAEAVPTSTVWRFLSIDDNNVGTFENAGDPSQRLLAKCRDPKRPAPDRGELYTLDNSGILRPQSGGKKFQRFEVMNK